MRKAQTTIMCGNKFGVFPDFRRRRRSEEGCCILRITAIIIAVSCSACSVAAFLPSSSLTLSSRYGFTNQISNKCLRTPSFTTRIPYTGATPIISTRLFSSNNSESDKQEWRSLVAAFQMYKAAYGDLKVPLRFVVPSMPPWPGQSLEVVCCPAFPLVCQFLHSTNSPYYFQWFSFLRIFVGNEIGSKGSGNQGYGKICERQTKATQDSGNAWFPLACPSSVILPWG